LREFEVMDPIHATRDQDGTRTVKRGQRRTLGAVKVGLPTVPVLGVSDDDSETKRISKQWHEDECRDALNDTDPLAAVEQLTILGVLAGLLDAQNTPQSPAPTAAQGLSPCRQISSDTSRVESRICWVTPTPLRVPRPACGVRRG